MFGLPVASAQRFFLSAGGPSFDPHGLDRDGDGNACEWGTKPREIHAARTPVQVARRVESRCYVGPRGGTYTITASGYKDYDGC
ncbi:excalibur calcium-binding domain-containing protein [Amaricoccus solimangrovi]|uniref:excalibur calcium-binding domain-containing protein n=1 Tax=Amaricoccus solimangrovi TaxID=2589815 RepID=UPI0034D2AEAB